MDNVLVCEGETDVILMRNLIEANGKVDTKYIAAGGWSSGDSLARSYLTAPTTKVVLVVDADSSDPKLIEERKRFLKRSLGQIADDTRWHVVVIAPEIERMLFDNKPLLEDLVQHEVNNTDFVEGQYNPKGVLQKITKMSRTQLFKRLSEINLDAIKNQPDIQGIRQFFSSKRRKAA